MRRIGLVGLLLCRAQEVLGSIPSAALSSRVNSGARLTCVAYTHQAVWSSDLILGLGVRGPEFNPHRSLSCVVLALRVPRVVLTVNIQGRRIMPGCLV